MIDSKDRPWYRRLHWQVLAGMVVGVIVGVVFGKGAVPWVGWMGTLFIKLLKMIIVPLILTSIVSGVASVGGGRGLGRLFGKTLGYYVLSSMLAILVGLVAVNLIQPGKGADLTTAEQKVVPEDLASPGSPVDLLLDIVPDNPVAAAVRGDMLSVIFFCIVLGMAIGSLPRRPRRILTAVFDAGFEAMMKLTGAVLAFVPLGVVGLMTNAITAFARPESHRLADRLADLYRTFKPMALYMATIATSLTLHLFVTLPLLLLLLGRIRPRIHFRNMVEPLALAFSTSSSAATLPVTLRTVEERVGVSNKVSSFVLPMGATVNMDGTALYECAGVIFISQVLGVGLTLSQQAVVVLTALLASIGAAAVPSAGLVIIFIVLEAVGLTGPQVELIVGFMLAVDRPLDMYRTAVNVFSDSCGAAIIARSEGEDQVDTEVAAD